MSLHGRVNRQQKMAGKDWMSRAKKERNESLWRRPLREFMLFILLLKLNNEVKYIVPSYS